MKMNNTVLILLSFLFAATLNCAAENTQQPQWPQHFGPHRTNRSAERNLLKEWPQEGPRKLWTYSQCGRGYSGVTIADGMIFTAGDFDKQEFVIALDMEGKLLWKQPNGKAWRGACPGSRATPTYNDGAVYHMNPNGSLGAYQAVSGKPLWAVDLKNEFDAQYGIWALAENVIVDGDKVICMPGGTKGRVVALDKRTGKTLWVNTEIEHAAAYCSGRVVTHNERRMLLSMTQRSIVGIDVANGKLLWSAPFVPRSPQNALTPVYENGYIFTACGHSSGGTLLKPDIETGTATTVWYREDIDDCHSGALLVDGRLYGSACRMGGKQFYCIDFLTGRDIKVDKTLGKVGITYADGMIYALNFQGSMHLIAANSDGFDLISRFELEKKPPNSYLALPVVCGGTLYIRCGNEIHAYSVSAN